MAGQTIFGELRPDQARYARLAGGMMSPLWLPFVAAAGMGAAWWMMQNWPRVAAGAVGDRGRSHGPGAAEAQPVQAAAAQARDFVQEAAAPATESPAVQGSDDSDAPVPAAPAERAATPEPVAPEPAAQAAEPDQPKPAARARPAPPRPKPAAKASPSGDGSAADDHPAPELPPHEGLPARKKGGGRKKS